MRRPIPTSNDDYYYSEDNYGGGNMTKNIKGKASHPIEKNKKIGKRRIRNGGCSSI